MLETRLARNSVGGASSGKWASLIGAILVIAFAFCSIPSCTEAVGAEESVAPEAGVLVNTLRAGLEQWVEEVQFSCHYELIKGFAATAHDGIAGVTGMNLTDERVSGVFNKSEAWVRHSLLYTTPPVKLRDLEGGQMEVRHVDVDEVSNGELLLAHRPEMLKGSPLAMFSSGNVAKASPGPFVAGTGSKGVLSPLSVGANAPGKTLEVRPGASNVTMAVKQQDSDHLTVDIAYTYNGYDYTKSVEFWTAPSPPVVIRSSMLMAGPDGGRYEEIVAASQFVKCPGGMVAQTVTSVSTNPRPIHPELPWFVVRWTSKDLGERPPTDADFEVPVVKGTRIHGLRVPRRGIVDGRLSLRHISIADLGDPEFPSGTIEDETTHIKVPLILAAIVLLVALATWLVWRGKSRHSYS